MVLGSIWRSYVRVTVSGISCSKRVNQADVWLHQENSSGRKYGSQQHY